MSQAIPAAWFVYLLACKGNRIYAGIAKDVQKRFLEHQSGKGAKFTRAFPPSRILKVIEAATYSDALKKEIALKRLSRPDKDRLILGEIALASA